jgi:uncharacterized protein (UPF0335 family)
MNISAEQLRQIVTKIERIEEEKATILEALRDVYSEAKSQGFDTKILKKVIKNRKIERSKLEEENELLQVYTDAIGG